MVDRVAAMLEAVARSPRGLTLTELATAVDAPMSSAQGLVYGLDATGYLQRTGTRYRLGPAPYLLNLLVDAAPTRLVREADLEALHGETGLSVSLGICVGDFAYYVAKAGDTDSHLSFVSDRHLRRPKLRCSVGRALLALDEDRDVWAYLDTLPEQDRPLVPAFLSDLSAIRETGVAINPGLADNGMGGVAISLTEPGGTPVAVAIAGMPAVISARKDELVALLCERRHEWMRRIT